MATSTWKNKPFIDCLREDVGLGPGELKAAMRDRDVWIQMVEATGSPPVADMSKRVSELQLHCHLHYVIAIFRTMEQTLIP